MNGWIERGGAGGAPRCLLYIATLALVTGCAATVAAPVSAESAPLDQFAPYRRMLWVTRWDYRTADDIARICRNAASARFTDIFFQVRGEGTVFFASAREPWAWELSGRGDGTGTGIDPGWDPLATALAEASRYGIRVHAYLNVLPAWAQRIDPPPASGHVLALNPGWLMHCRAGRPMASGWYRFLDPGLPEVREHLAAVFAEVARNYPALAGVHLDYVRYPFEHGDYSYSPAVVERFRAVHGGAPAELPEEWIRFRGEQISALVQRISEAVRRERPDVEISAAVIADAHKGEVLGGQQPELWLRRGWIDAVAPMAYTGQREQFELYSERFRRPELAGRVWFGLLADPEKNGMIDDQIRQAAGMGMAGVALFAYSNLFHQHRSNELARMVYEIFAATGGGP